MVKAKKIVLASPMQGFPTESNFSVEEEDLDEAALKENEMLVETVFLSVDPYMRAFSRFMPEATPVGSTMIGEVVAKVIVTKSNLFNKGDLVLAQTGWRTHSIVNALGQKEGVRPYPLIGSELSPSLALGVVGMTGATAYFGFLDLCTPRAGDVVVVNAGAGAVGSLVGQIAKIKGCTVIGYAGSQEKVDYMKQLGFDHGFNYKVDDLDSTLKQAAPDGVDCYFDNVGGEFSSTVLKNMRRGGRIAVCGNVSAYNSKTVAKVEDPTWMFIAKDIKMTGFMVNSWDVKKWHDEAFPAIIDWIKEDKVKYRETVTKGFENTPKAFMELLNGSNIGKAVVKMEGK